VKKLIRDDLNPRDRPKIVSNTGAAIVKGSLA
jgi:hypothetical protein